MNDIDLIINKFEYQKFSDKENGKTTGVFYTPWNFVDFIVSNSFKLYFEKYFNNLFNSKMKLDPNRIIQLLNKTKNLRSNLKSEINNIKILDPASGSGRFLMTTANYLFKIYKLVNENLSDYLIKKKIIQDHIYGIDIDEDANIISNLRLINWLYYGTNSDISYEISSDLTFSDIRQELSQLDVKCQIFNKDYLLDFNQKGFDIILGNPPYVENKKITDKNYKKKIYSKFESAYKLFDLSVVFIEKSIKILNPKKGILSFLTPNKFLAADYGIKIRKFILDNAHIQEIINISSLNSFKHTSTYPIILFLKKGRSHSNFLSIQEFENIQQLDNHKGSKFYTFSQDMIRNFPSYTIPLSTNIELIDRVYSKHEMLSENLKDLKIIYRPFGFVNWVNQSKYIIEKKHSFRDMILLGTGNINRYCIDFNKPVKVAKNRYLHPFFSFNKRHKDIWNTLSSEKLIFREIAKDLSFVYDPGIIVNLTGLYFLKISSYNTNQLFGLLAILNSKLINTLYKSLFGTLHMSSGYLRFNGSFIKRLPAPKKIPMIISILGMILHFLYQLRLELKKQSKFLKLIEINPNKFSLLLDFYENLTNNYVENLYLNNQIKNDLFEKTFYAQNIPDFKFKLIGANHCYSNFEYYSEDEINIILGNIYKFYNENHKINNAFN